jgi:hypothetical protein
MKERRYCHWCGCTNKPIAVLDYGVHVVCGLRLPVGAIASCSWEHDRKEHQRRLGNAVLRLLPWEQRWDKTTRRAALASLQPTQRGK